MFKTALNIVPKAFGIRSLRFTCPVKYEVIFAKQKLFHRVNILVLVICYFLKNSKCLVYRQALISSYYVKNRSAA